MTKLTEKDVGSYGLLNSEGAIVAEYRVVGTNKTATGVVLPETRYIVEFKDWNGTWGFSGANRDDPAAFVAQLVKL